MVDHEQTENSEMSTTVSARNSVAQGESLADRIYFEVPFEQKQIAKAAGLRWDGQIRRWYTTNKEIAEAFSRSAQCAPAAAARVDRLYFKVPYLQKYRAKAAGMRFDGIRKLWFAPNQTVAVDAARIFKAISDVIDNDIGPKHRYRSSEGFTQDSDLQQNSSSDFP